MLVSDVLANPNAYLGDRISIEGSVHIADFADNKKHVWLSDPINDRDQELDPSCGLLIAYPGIEYRIVPTRAGCRKFPYVGFECEGVFVKTIINQCSYAIMDLTAIKYRQFHQDEWEFMGRSLVPERFQLLDIISWPVSDELHFRRTLTG